MKKIKTTFVQHIFIMCIIAVVLAGCDKVKPHTTQTMDSPTDVPPYNHFAPSKDIIFHLEFDYPSSWIFEYRAEYEDLVRIFLEDPRYHTLIRYEDGLYPINDFGNVFIFSRPAEENETSDTEIEIIKQNKNLISRMEILGEYKITIDGYPASVFEYNLDDPESYSSVMYNKTIIFIVDGQQYFIDFMVATKDRGGEFEQGFEYFFNSLKIVP